MSLRIGIVVATHPEDHSVDLVMSDDGSRLVGVQVLTGSGSARTGTVDMPKIPASDNKWDITKTNGQDMKAVVGSFGPHPIVLGFLYPQINQVLPSDPETLYGRHQSDVAWSIDGGGNIQITHPGGAYIRVGESPDKVDLTGRNADASLAYDRNTGKQVNVRIGLAGNTVEVTLAPSGAVTVKANTNVVVQAGSGVTLDTPLVHCTHALTVDGPITGNGGMAVSGGSGASMSVNGSVQITGPQLTHNGKNVGSTHAHTGVRAGSDQSGVPV